MWLSGKNFDLSRRRLLAGPAALLILLMLRHTSAATADPVPVVRVGSVRGGTLSWLLDEIATYRLDRTAGVRIEAIVLSSPEAGEAARREGLVDIVVADRFWVSRARSAGAGDWTCAPYSSANGSLVALPAAPIHELDDLKGRRVGVVGTPHDQAWTILRLAAHRSGWNLAENSRPEFGSPSEIAARLESADFDVALLIWPWAVRLGRWALAP